MAQFACNRSRHAMSDIMEYDFIIVGAGPAGLAAAIRLKQLAADKSVCVLEKGASVGAHSISGAVLTPGRLETLLPHWQRDYPGMKVPALRDEFFFMTRNGATRFPLVPRTMHNRGNFIVSLGQLTPWLAQQAEALGVDVFAGFAAAAPVFDDAGGVKGVRIGDMGVQRDGTPGPNY